MDEGGVLFAPTSDYAFHRLADQGYHISYRSLHGGREREEKENAGKQGRDFLARES